MYNPMVYHIHFQMEACFHITIKMMQYGGGGGDLSITLLCNKQTMSLFFEELGFVIETIGIPLVISRDLRI